MKDGAVGKSHYVACEGHAAPDGTNRIHTLQCLAISRMQIGGRFTVAVSR